MRILVDYRPALRERTGVGEYVHEVARALAASSSAAPDDVLHLFSSSWRDRAAPEIPGTHVIDRRVPVRLLNVMWHRLGWPPIELLAGAEFDVVQSMHPLLLPASRAAQVITIHDLDFLEHPERTHGEIRRDYPHLARPHALRADHIVVVSEFTRSEVQRLIGVPRSKISVCSIGAPNWPRREREPAPAYLLFLGTLEPRKNVGALLDAYARLVTRRPDMPRLVLAGRATPDAAGWLAQAALPPLEGRVDVLGYVAPDRRLALYQQALALVMPSHNEGFGIPALEAMTVGVPVIAANRGALPEVLGDAGLLFDPGKPEALADRLERVVQSEALRDSLRARGWARAARYTWNQTAATTREAWALAIEARRRRA